MSSCTPSSLRSLLVFGDAAIHLFFIVASLYLLLSCLLKSWRTKTKSRFFYPSCFLHHFLFKLNFFSGVYSHLFCFSVSFSFSPLSISASWLVMAVGSSQHQTLFDNWIKTTRNRFQLKKFMCISIFFYKSIHCNTNFYLMKERKGFLNRTRFHIISLNLTKTDQFESSHMQLLTYLLTITGDLIRYPYIKIPKVNHTILSNQLNFFRHLECP